MQYWLDGFLAELSVYCKYNLFDLLKSPHCNIIIFSKSFLFFCFFNSFMVTLASNQEYILSAFL